ncbi:MAG: hypothetical protein WBA97_38360 [Actinophytocola sp.]|uniref:hypothetical protein n=1 Tax=Actinophytocola sp. TaxID=1872138 RepID=UPI003C73CF89
MSTSPLVQKYCARKLRRVTVSVLVWVVALGFTVFLGNALVHKLSDSHTEVTVTATEETTKPRSTGSRRTRHIEQARALWVEYVYQGEQQRDKLIADEHNVGDTFTAYLNDRTNTLVLTESTTGFMDWLIPVALLLIVPTWGWFMFRSLGRTVRLRGFDPESATTRFALTVHKVTPRQGGKVAYLRATGVVTATTATDEALRAGKPITLESYANTMPPATRFPAQLDVREIPDGGLARTVLARATGTADWWVATATEPVAALDTVTSA